MSVYLMPRPGLDLERVVEPADSGHRLRLDLAVEDEAFPVILLANRRLAGERGRFAVHLPAEMEYGLFTSC